MANSDNKAKEASNNVSNYAAQHPRRMYSTMLVLGSAIGAGIMAAKKNHDRNGVQKIVDQISSKL